MISATLTARVSLERNGFHFTKSLGQHFLLSDFWLNEIVSAAEVSLGERVLEIGAGAGVLTACLLERGADVLAYELDESLRPVLQDVLAERPGARVVFGDALRANLADSFGGARFRVVANLPYYITADAVLRLLTGGLPLSSVVLLVQTEAAERIMAKPGAKNYSALSAVAQYAARCEALRSVPRDAFTPPPHVDSTLVRLTPYGPCDEAVLKVVRAAFAMRRKTLVNNLSGLPGVSREAAQAAVAACGFPVTVRGELLAPEDFVRLAALLSVDKGPGAVL